MELIAAFAGWPPSERSAASCLVDLATPRNRRKQFMSSQRVPDYEAIADAIVTGTLVYFFGAGINLCGRPSDVCWSVAQETYLPDGRELAKHLAQRFGYPSTNLEVDCPHCSEPLPSVATSHDLARVSQYVDVMRGEARLYQELHQIFHRDYPLTPLHRFVAALPAHLRSRDLPANQVLITTNYDDLMERAFAEVNEPYDTLTYVAVGTDQGKFLHCPSGETVAKAIEVPNEYTELKLNQRSVIVKIHGAVTRTPDSERDNYVITEDHYIDFPSQTISNLVPVTLAQKLRRSSYLFLGYGLRDWNLRVFLNRVWRERRLRYQSWAVQLNPALFDERFWSRNYVEIYNARLESFIEGLQNQLQVTVAGSEP